MGASKILGILSIILALLSPIVALILGIIGLSIKKDEEHYNRDVTLNTIGIILSVLAWIISFLYLL